jgi:hypothetical protein
MELKWMVRDAEREYGPYTIPQLAEFLLPIHHVRQESSDAWLPAYQDPALESLFETGAERLFRNLWSVETADGEGLGPISTDSMKELIFEGRILLTDRVRYASWEEARILRDTSLVSRASKEPIYGDRLYRVTATFRVANRKDWSFQRLILAARRTAAREAMRDKLQRVAGDLKFEITRIDVEEARHAQPYT